MTKVRHITYILSRDSITSGILLASGICKGEPLDDSNTSRAVFQKPGFIHGRQLLNNKLVIYVKFAEKESRPFYCFYFVVTPWYFVLLKQDFAL